MKHCLPALATTLMLALATGASAQTTKPGLWEITNKMQSSSGEMEKAMATMEKQLASMPPEQRKQMQDMMAKQGMSMGSSAGGAMNVKMCITKEMAERNELPQQQQGDCKTTQSPRSGNTMKFSYVCTQPPSSGEGVMTFNGDTAYTMKMNTTTNVKGKAEKMTMDASGKWLSADCGNIKPRK
ncbi:MULTISPECIES: DUF3617 domain-containing protein [unclassified Polaromonas]|uniref:DUF3617 domain-containing protein n=1 Tax=unclassified Polaromonas TaxID=2638319 RepID=UPI000F07A1D0|nr:MULTISPECIES: DUF3617 domain-containing protein [unclassified Polaromonas]AYQ27426.1 DUF3617 domain-containing protein [Polaromonas sp. SP1]QGJ17731.1 DUF3617 family protein [Polaromonas sp. Pch-P]